jgi:hypothetical protein
VTPGLKSRLKAGCSQDWLPHMVAVMLLMLLSTGCGYHVGGRADTLPKTLRTIAVPAFDNLTVRYTLSERLPAAITREFLTRTRYQVIPDEKSADAVLRGAVANIMTFPVVTDQATARATGVQIVVVMQMNLTERATGKVLFNRPIMEFRQRYEVAVEQSVYFEESDIALERLSRDVARAVVSSVVEAF